MPPRRGSREVGRSFFSTASPAARRGMERAVEEVNQTVEDAYVKDRILRDPEERKRAFNLRYLTTPAESADYLRFRAKRDADEDATGQRTPDDLNRCVDYLLEPIDWVHYHEGILEDILRWESGDPQPGQRTFIHSLEKNLLNRRVRGVMAQLIPPLAPGAFQPIRVPPPDPVQVGPPSAILASVAPAAAAVATAQTQRDFQQLPPQVQDVLQGVLQNYLRSFLSVDQQQAAQLARQFRDLSVPTAEWTAQVLGLMSSAENQRVRRQQLQPSRQLQRQYNELINREPAFVEAENRSLRETLQVYLAALTKNVAFRLPHLADLVMSSGRSLLAENSPSMDQFQNIFQISMNGYLGSAPPEQSDFSSPPDIADFSTFADLFPSSSEPTSPSSSSSSSSSQRIPSPTAPSARPPSPPFSPFSNFLAAEQFSSPTDPFADVDTFAPTPASSTSRISPRSLNAFSGQ